MKKLLSALVLGVLLSSAYAKTPIENYVLSLPKESLSKVEINDLLHMREEEKLARDVYLTLYKKWKLPVFKNISKSENWHMHMIKLLLDKYGLNDPVEKTGDRVGVFESKKLQKLYNELVEKGSMSLKDALMVGATIEDLDIKDLEEAIKRSNNKDINLVYQNLEKGSRNHMRAFVGVLRRYGGDYTPQFISMSEFNQIISSKHEMGMMKSSKYYNNEFYGVVERVYTLPGLRKGIYWWMADVKTDNATLKVAIAPTWTLQNINIRPGDRVEVKGYKGMYSFITCEIEDKTTSLEYKSKSRRCK
ncbi:MULTISPECIES: DUF2202 domain-containing protein [unclassified Lebetimonas]|uniref:DUF2202 domain-containing protein n=1 Tax=unclassified Lebetimonas TaxID=2648158 RepID=UPI000464DB81|nr:MULTISPECIES: DUF2202 domain-containing protein [unclassified Lebetimonas]